MLTGTLRSREDAAFGPHDFRLIGCPKFAEDHFAQNLELVDRLKAIAEAKGCTVGQLALAWVHAQAKKHWLEAVVPIPGTTSLAHLKENIAAQHIKLSREELAQIEAVFPLNGSAGDRYAHMAMTFHGNKDGTPEWK
mmetsp:Transcript_150802/g.263577  ORF Transcript_150802/g.263577 Transcript_150802/m.263577 type:complete len:137 (-) Transcript_150802:23-433(-)